MLLYLVQWLALLPQNGKGLQFNSPTGQSRSLYSLWSLLLSQKHLGNLMTIGANTLIVNLNVTCYLLEVFLTYMYMYISVFDQDQTAVNAKFSCLNE